MKAVEFTEVIAIVITIALFLTAACLQTAEKEVTLTVFHAGSLSKPMEELTKAYGYRHPGVIIQREARGSLETIKKITELKREGDLVAVADYNLIPEMMIPEHAEWAIKFAKNRMVIAYSNKSKYASEINASNWYDMLAKSGVEVGRANPDTDPCGYRTIMVLDLAEKYYGKAVKAEIFKNSLQKNIRDTEVELVSTLQLGEIDYLFIYESVAAQYDLSYIRLPEQIDLSSEDHASFYSTAKVEIMKGNRTITVKGEPIIYGVTIPMNATNAREATEFLEFILSAEGRAILQKNSQLPLAPAIASDINKIPVELKPYVAGGAKP